MKRDHNGKIERYKSRLCAKGCAQRNGIDYGEVFAPVTRHTTIRTLLALTAAHDLEIAHLDVKTAFLHGNLEEEIYMVQPKGYEIGGAGMVCKLVKGLYGLKQAPRCWHAKLKGALEAHNFRMSHADPSLFVLDLPDDTVYLLVYVEDLLIAARKLASVDLAKNVLMKEF